MKTHTSGRTHASKADAVRVAFGYQDADNYHGEVKEEDKDKQVMQCEDALPVSCLSTRSKEALNAIKHSLRP